MLKPKDIKHKLLISIAILFFAAIMYAFKIPCVILNLTGIKCIGCGMTRALISAIKLDFASAFSYHGMFWSVPILYLFFLFDGKIFKNKFINISLLLALLIGFIINWIIHL